MKNYTFQGNISKEVLESYLSRAVTAADLINSDTLEDDLRMIGNIGAKFLGRSSGVWSMEPDDEEHFRKSQALAERVHALDAEIILQTCIFEVVYIDVEKVKIPLWVFEAFNQAYEERTFRYAAMLFDNSPLGYGSDGTCALPNITKLETQMWFYYRAVRYIEAGFEAIHMGQIHLYSADDIGYKMTYALFEMIRGFAKKHARRKMILLDAHTHGVNVNGQLLFDFHSMPLSRMPILDLPGEKIALVREGFYEGGLTPSGWHCDTAPILMEFDNWGGKFFNEEEQIPYEKRAWLEWWGYDQITWFALQDEASRNKYLEYTFKWTAINNVNAYFQMPFRRTLGSCRIKKQAYGTRKEMISDCYKANRQSEACALGFGQEETIKRIWAAEGSLRERAGNPQLTNQFGAENDYDLITGVKLPSRVVLFGNFQNHLGAINHDSNSEVTRMYYLGNGEYKLSCVFPFKGQYDYAVAPYGTLSSISSIDNYPRSGSSTKAKLHVEQDNMVVKFTYSFTTRTVKVEFVEGM